LVTHRILFIGESKTIRVLFKERKRIKEKKKITVSKLDSITHESVEEVDNNEIKKKKKKKKKNY